MPGLRNCPRCQQPRARCRCVSAILGDSDDPATIPVGFHREGGEGATYPLEVVETVDDVIAHHGVITQPTHVCGWCGGRYKTRDTRAAIVLFRSHACDEGVPIEIWLEQEEAA